LLYLIIIPAKAVIMTKFKALDIIMIKLIRWGRIFGFSGFLFNKIKKKKMD